jgi:repressor LexA
MTPKEHKLLDYIREQIETTGICPTYREMAEAMSVKGRAKVWEIVERLVADGYLVKFARHRNRGLGLPTPHLATVPTSALLNELRRRGQEVAQ